MLKKLLITQENLIDPIMFEEISPANLEILFLFLHSVRIVVSFWVIYMLFAWVVGEK
jgi:hypothetical protein